MSFVFLSDHICHEENDCVTCERGLLEFIKISGHECAPNEEAIEATIFNCSIYSSIRKSWRDYQAFKKQMEVKMLFKNFANLIGLRPNN